ncbi:hypothetical protein Ana3638_08555 [Anaerocolumna sedimenticola]|uniref:Uncharacterized protein n=1 Tax=Anaerocolumna sedimenticola TaxID=2696063 RepID=A0A6P1TLB9_9FIRM|nr:hypothetical protein [Anaerocolumna sedimenticola]QHQ60811.1 hypothetical protein Ana3638_08555 [Anaerocolumna sedimenticola]
MATTNANDSRPRDNRGNARLNDNHRPGTSRETGMTGQGNRDNKPFNRENKPYNKDNKSSNSYSRENKPYNKDSKPYGRKDSNDTRTTGSYNNRTRNLKGGGYNKDNDYDNDNKYGKGYSSGKDQRMGDSRSRTSPNKEKEQQPDKFETIKRLEREKKAIQKKSQEINKKSERPNKPQLKHRRTNNIDWTKGYANGRYGDDDEDYTEFM